MTYDSTDSDSDGVIEANVDNELVNTDVLSNVYDHVLSSNDNLNDFIANTLSSDDSVKLGPGTYTVTKSGLNALEIIGGHVTLEGVAQGVTTIKLEDNASTDSNNLQDEAIIAIGTEGGASPSGVEIRDLTIDGNKANQTTNSNERVNGISPRGADDITI